MRGPTLLVLLALAGAGVLSATTRAKAQFLPGYSYHFIGRYPDTICATGEHQHTRVHMWHYVSTDGRSIYHFADNTVGLKFNLAKAKAGGHRTAAGIDEGTMIVSGDRVQEEIIVKARTGARAVFRVSFSVSGASCTALSFQVQSTCQPGIVKGSDGPGEPFGCEVQAGHPPACRFCSQADE